MENHCFSFLEDSYSDICNEAKFCEKHLVQKNYVDSIIRAGKASEIITVYICEFEGQEHLISSSQKHRLEMLGYNGFIKNDLTFIILVFKLVTTVMLAFISVFPFWPKSFQYSSFFFHKYNSL